MSKDVEGQRRKCMLNVCLVGLYDWKGDMDLNVECIGNEANAYFNYPKKIALITYLDYSKSLVTVVCLPANVRESWHGDQEGYNSQ